MLPLVFRRHNVSKRNARHKGQAGGDGSTKLCLVAGSADICLCHSNLLFGCMKASLLRSTLHFAELFRKCPVVETRLDMPVA